MPADVVETTVGAADRGILDLMTTPAQRPIALQVPAIRATLDRSFWLAMALGSAASLIGLGLLAAIIPNPVFGRLIPPDGAAIAVWIASAPLMGALLATYLTGRGMDQGTAGGRDLETGGLTIGGLASFFAIGCPICN